MIRNRVGSKSAGHLRHPKSGQHLHHPFEIFVRCLQGGRHNVFSRLFLMIIFRVSSAPIAAVFSGLPPATSLGTDDEEVPRTCQRGDRGNAELRMERAHYCKTKNGSEKLRRSSAFLVRSHSVKQLADSSNLFLRMPRASSRIL